MVGLVPAPFGLFAEAAFVLADVGKQPVGERSTGAGALREALGRLERDLGRLADDGFSPTYLRNATAYGVSPRIRFDLVRGETP